MDRLLGGRLGQQERHLSQRVADLPHAQGQVAAAGDNARLCRPGRIHGRRQGHRHSRQRYDQGRESESSLAVARARKKNADQLSLLEARVSTAPLVPGIREKVKAWRDGGYKGITATTR